MCFDKKKKKNWEQPYIDGGYLVTMLSLLTQSSAFGISVGTNIFSDINYKIPKIPKFKNTENF